MAGDQQAATIGQGCLQPGDTKATFGTGAFILTNSGEEPPHSANRLLATVLCQIGGTRSYALEGSVFVAGSLMQWLRDRLGLMVTAPKARCWRDRWRTMAGVYMVPAFAGWRAALAAEARA